MSRRQHIRSCEYRRRLNIKYTITQEVSRARLRLFLKTARAELSCTSYSCTFANALIEEYDKYRHKAAGRPLKSWMRCVSDDLRKLNYDIFSARALARGNASKYRQIFLEG